MRGIITLVWSVFILMLANVAVLSAIGFGVGTVELGILLLLNVTVLALI